MDVCLEREASKDLRIVRNFTIDEGLAPRSRFAGTGFKPLQAAGVKSLVVSVAGKGTAMTVSGGNKRDERK
jgi:hypothetical protein